jgi:hypothetical protein
MTQNSITFEHPRTGVTRTVSLGFCWRLLQFGAFLPIYHRQWPMTFVVVAGQTLTFGISNVVIAFYYNRFYIKSLVAAGFLARGTEFETLDEVEARLGLTLPRHLPSDEPPGYGGASPLSA